jgi:hypothetical protein
MQQSRTESNRAMLSRKRFLSLLLGSYVALCPSCRAPNRLYRYPEMIDIHVEILASALRLSNPQDIQERLNEKLRSFANGEIPHAANAVSALFAIMACYHASESPPETGNSNIQTKSKCTWATGGTREAPPHQKYMNIALINSMRHGSFLDMEYRVRKKRIGVDRFTPIYLSGTIFHSVRSKLDARRSCSSYPLCHFD